MELKDLPDGINSRLKEHSLAFATLEEGFFDDKITILHPDPKDYFIGSKITITYSLGWWYIDYQETIDSDVTMKMQIQSTDNLDDIQEMVKFVNNHTMHQTPEKTSIKFKDNDLIKNMVKE